MTAGQTLNEKMQGKGEFFHLADRASDHLFIEKVWRCHTDRGDTFLSVAANSFEMVLTRLRGKSFLTLRGPETTVTPVDCPAEGRWVGIRFKPGIFMPRFLPGSLRDHNDVTLPPATGQSFWLNGSALEYPSFDNGESLVKRLAKSGILSCDPIVEDTLLRRPRELSLRSAQRHFLPLRRCCWILPVISCRTLRHGQESKTLIVPQRVGAYARLTGQLSRTHELFSAKRV